MKVKVDYEHSAIVDYTNPTDAGHQYLKLVFIPEKMSSLYRASQGNRSSFQMNFYPLRNRDGSIDEQFEKAIIEEFNSKTTDAEPIYIDKVEVPIPPTIMTYQSNSKNHNAGDMIMEGNNPRIYETVTITCLMKLTKDGEVPVDDTNALRTRAMSIWNYRVEQGQWIPAEEYIPEPDEAAEAAVIVDEPEPQPIRQPQRPTAPNRR